MRGCDGMSLDLSGFFECVKEHIPDKTGCVGALLTNGFDDISHLVVPPGTNAVTVPD